MVSWIVLYCQHHCFETTPPKTNSSHLFQPCMFSRKMLVSVSVKPPWSSFVNVGIILAIEQPDCWTVGSFGIKWLDGGFHETRTAEVYQSWDIPHHPTVVNTCSPLKFSWHHFPLVFWRVSVVSDALYIEEIHWKILWGARRENRSTVWHWKRRQELPQSNKHASGRNPYNQFRLVVYPIIYVVFDILCG